MVYRITENSPPGKTGISSFQEIDDTNAEDQFVILPPGDRPRLVEFPFYQIVNDGATGLRELPNAPTPVVIETTVVNSSATLSARYEDTAGITGITTRTLLTNNGFGLSTFTDISPVIWDTGNNKINVYNDKEIIELQIRLRASTDTLGGAFEVELETVSTATVIDTQEYNINIQEQDYTVTFKIVTSTADTTNGISIYVKPELGMTLDLVNIEFVFIRTTQL